MKLMCISDIHGSIDNLNKLLEKYKEEKAEKLIILGDFSNYYSSSTDFEIAEILNNIAGSIIAVKGNCDSSLTEELLHFSLDLLKTIEINGKRVTITHGHIYNKNNLPENLRRYIYFRTYTCRKYRKD